MVSNRRFDDYFACGISLLADSIKADTIFGINERATGRMLEKALLAVCSKTCRYKAPETPRTESYSPVRRNDEG
jgi:hypothetical protein